MVTPQHLLVRLANNLGIDDVALDNAICLSEGNRGRLVIVAMEPCDLADRVEYSELCDRSPTLREVDRLIEKVDNLSSLEDVPFFNTTALLSRAKQKELANAGALESDLYEAHKAFYHMIRAQKPDVVLLMHCQAGKSRVPDVKKFETQEYLAGELDVLNIDNRDILVVRGFHPSTYLRSDYRRKSHDPTKEADLRREVAEHCFKMAFKALEGVEVVDNDLRDEWMSLVSSKNGRRRTRGALGQDKEARKKAKLDYLREEHLKANAPRSDLGLSAQLDNLKLAGELPTPSEPSTSGSKAGSKATTLWQVVKGLENAVAQSNDKGPRTPLLTIN